VREALRRLAAEGLVRFVPNQGACVTSVDAKGLADIFSLRMLLEPHAAELAATRLDAAALSRLRDQARRMDRLEATRPARCMQLIAAENTAFHLAIVEASGNARLAGIVGNLIEQVIVISTFSRYTPADLRRSMGHHMELVDAFEHRDGAWAASVMRSHVSAALHACMSAAKGGAVDAAA
jgi:DNA-binding GntR family transcriptional regulator